MLSPRARGVLHVARTWERVHSGTGKRDAATRARAEAAALAAELNAKAAPELGSDVCA